MAFVRSLMFSDLVGTQIAVKDYYDTETIEQLLQAHRSDL